MFYHTSGLWQEGLDVLGRAITALETAGKQSGPDRSNQIALGRVLATHSLLASRMGLYEQAQGMLERSLNILRPLHEPHVLVEPIAYLGLAMEYTGNYARALELYSEGLEIARAIGDRWYAALCFTLLTSLEGITLSMVGLEVAFARFQSAVADWRTIGDPTFTAVGLANLSQCALSLGRYAEARTALEESVNLCISVGERWELGFAYRGLGLVAQAQGEHQQALVMFKKSLDTFTELGARHEMARVLAEMSRSIFELGNVAEAERKWRESLRIANETQGTFIVLEALVGLASLQAKRSNREPALVLLWMVLNHPASLQETKNRASDLRAELEAQLTGQQVEAVRERAQTTTLETVVEEVLKQVALS
jgi:tetratricopeptide (TPR) repeat protein